MMMVQETSRSQPQAINSSGSNNTTNSNGRIGGSNMATREASCIYALITDKRSVSRRNRVSWYLRQLNKVVKNDEMVEETPEAPNVAANSDDINTPVQDGNETPMEQVAKGNDIDIVSILCNTNASLDAVPLGLGKVSQFEPNCQRDQQQQSFFVTPNTRVSFLSKSIATSIVLDLSPSVVSVSSHNNCVFLDSMYDALKRVLHLLVKSHEIPSSLSETKPYHLQPKVFVSVIAYTPFVVAKNNQVLVQNRRISRSNIDQVLVEIWICLTKITQEIHELVSYTCVTNLDFNTTSQTVNNGNVFVFPQPINGGVIRHPGSVLEDIYELGLFSSSLMPKLSRLSLVIITDGLFSSTNNLNIFRLKSIAVSFISLGSEATYPDTCFGYTPYTDLMKFVAKTTLGFYLSHKDLIDSSYGMPKMKQLLFTENPLHNLFSWTLHSETQKELLLYEITPKAIDHHHHHIQVKDQDPIEISSEHLVKYFCYDQPMEALADFSSSYSSSDSRTTNSKMSNCHDWRSFRQMERNLDADFEQVLSCLLREGYLIRSIQFKRKETTRIVARLVLHWRHNLDLEQELIAPYWSSTDPYELEDKSHRLIMRPFNTPLYGDTYCEVIVHGSYSFLHNLYCDRKSSRKRAEYRDIAYKQFRQLIDGVLQTHERLQYLSRFYRDSSLSKIPSFLLHGNSLLYEQPHTHRLTATIENVTDESRPNEFQEYWQKISCLDNKSWKNLMHIHTLRLVLEHDQPKHKNIHYQNANGRYTHVQCRRALSAVSTFIKSYASFALLEDTTYVKFIYNRDDDLREIETSATKGFIVIRINKLLPIIVIYLMFTSGILDSHRVQIVAYLEDQLTNCKLRNGRTSSTVQMENIIKSKTISSSSESCCALIRSPLERMLKVYGRNFVNDYLINNWSYGLPGSCPYSMQQAVKLTNYQTDSSNGQQQQASKQRSGETTKDNVEGYTSDNSTHRYNLVFGKYLYGVRVVQKISNLPHGIIPSLAANVLSKISAILVNLRIKQGFHIAFNNSGILNLVVELAMKDHSHDDHTSSCLCQYIVFPPTVTTNNPQANIHSILQNNHTSSNSGGVLTTASKSNSLSGSLVNSDGHMKSAQESIQAHLIDNGEIRMIKEYWIEQQYGLSCERPESYHHSLENMRYSEIVDHLFVTDSSIFECLLTYDLLQLLCDKMSLYYKLDNSLSKAETSTSPSSLSTSSSHQQADFECPYQDHHGAQNNPKLPSALIDGTNTKDRTPKVPLLELEYKFSVLNFLDFCQQASLTVLLFKDRSDYHECRSTQRVTDEKLAAANEHRNQRQRFRMMQAETTSNSSHLLSSSGGGRSVPMSVPIKCMQSRKMSMDINDLSDSGCEPCGSVRNKREHRSSYQQEQADMKMHSHTPPTYTYLNPIYSPSLNHMFLETLHKRLKQMHDKELKLSDYDQRRLPLYLKRRHSQQQQQQQHEMDSINGPSSIQFHSYNINRINSLTPEVDEFSSDMDDDEMSRCCGGFDMPDRGDPASIRCDVDTIDWRCFLRKGNQENLMIVLVPATLSDITKWLNFINNNPDNSDWPKQNYDLVCPLFVFRCSSTMINEHVMSFLKDEDCLSSSKSPLESDLSLHFGQPCTYIGQLKAYNDELNNEILPLTRTGIPNQIATSSDEKTLEVVHFRAFLRKIKNTVLKSRFNSLNDAYLSELFVHKDDILYYINNVDLDTQKKYHISTQLKSLADFIKNYEEYNDSLPKEPAKPCNPLLNSILLQKCGLFINQPIARFNESNPLMRQLHDKKLLYLMRCNYKVELPIIEENLASSTLLRKYIKLSTSSSVYNHTSAMVPPPPVTPSSTQTNEKSFYSGNASSLSKSEGARLMEMKCGSYGTSGMGITTSGSPNAVYSNLSESKSKHQPRLGSNPTLNSLPNSANENFILEVFRGTKSCSIKEVDLKDSEDISLRHEAHMAEVLKRTSERKESHHYRRVLKSKTNYNQSHGAIDQALKRVDSLGRLEHFCLTPLLFSSSWRSRLAPVRDHTLESNTRLEDCDDRYEGHHYTSNGKDVQGCDLESSTETNGSSSTSANQQQQQQSAQQEAEDRWHQTVCNNYIKEYEQYIQTLGFNSVQIRYQSQPKISLSALQSTSSSASKSTTKRYSTSSFPANISSQSTSSSSTINKPATSSSLLVKSSTTSATNQLGQSSSGTYNTSYLIKFLNSGCLVFKVGFCKPYVYSILYSIEGERFNNSNMKMNMTTFLDELDNIKVTMHLHSFTYDYHLRCMYSYISGRQLNFSPGYHLITFLDDFRKYYQKAPNYARNHILCGEVCVLTNIKVTGQQLYNYIVTHNKAYNMEVLEMCSPVSNLIISNLSNGRSFIDNNNRQNQSNLNSMKDQILAQESNLSRSHANDYVLIELNREKVRYRDGKDPDIFDCGLLITHDVLAGQSSRNTLTLKYFLLLTNQRDLYPKLIHTYDNIVSTGCHRPIRLGVSESISRPSAANTKRGAQGQVGHKVSGTTAPSSGQSDLEDVQSSELQSSGEVSGPQSILSTANSTQSSGSGLQFGPTRNKSARDLRSLDMQLNTSTSSDLLVVPSIQVEVRLETEEATDALMTSSTDNSLTGGEQEQLQVQQQQRQQTNSLVESSSVHLDGDLSPLPARKRVDSTNSSKKNAPIGGNLQERAICDEEITYLGYFSSDEMDMLKFLQEKTNNLRAHIEQVVRQAEIHYRRDYLWQKLMQRTPAAINQKSDEIPLSSDELLQLFSIVETIGLSSLDPQLTVFTTMHLNWYMKLLKAFSDLKQSNMNQHRIYTMKTNKYLLLYIDPKCSTAFILLSIDPERSSIELNLLLKDKQEINSRSSGQEKSPNKLGGGGSDQLTLTSSSTMDIDQDCQQLINDFINFTASFMWSTFFA